MKEEELLTNLPVEIINNILSRLPVLTIITCKCVCKSLLNILRSHDFMKYHLAKSKPGYLFSLDEGERGSSFLIQIVEFKDPLDFKCDEVQYNLITKFDVRAITGSFISNYYIVGSAYGLVFLIVTNKIDKPIALYIFNPITRDYITLPQFINRDYCSHSTATYGFGITKTTGKYKVVRFFYATTVGSQRPRKFIVEVYTLGTGSWRTILPSTSVLLKYTWGSGVFLNGNLYWLAKDFNDCYQISCFDLLTEVLSTFSCPPEKFEEHLVALKDCLCLYDYDPDNDEYVIWSMKDDGVEESWTKSFVISIRENALFRNVIPIKVWKDGDYLLAREGLRGLFYYSNKTSASTRDGLSELRNYFGMLHGQSFLSLKNFCSRKDVEPFWVS